MKPRGVLRLPSPLRGGSARSAGVGVDMRGPEIKKSSEWIHEGKYAAEVEIELHYTGESWAPTMSLDDARKLETVMLALRRGNIAEAAKHGRVFALTPVAAK